MTALPDRRRALGVLPFAVAGAIVAAIAASPLPGKGGALLLALLFWVAVVEGCVAAAAAGTLVNARWMRSEPLKKALLSVCPLLLLVSLLFFLLIPFLSSYPWAKTPGLWLRKDFFFARNLALLLLAYFTAASFASAARRDGDAAKTRATYYLFAFVASQSLSAFDLVMSLAYPWPSTLFGGYFFIESIYGGFAVAAVLALLLRREPAPSPSPRFRSDVTDLSVVVFGFGILWAGLFFAQFLVIWYGNIPEEVGYIAERLATSPLRELSVAILFLFFFIPFPVFLSTRAKSNAFTVSAVAFCILAGIFVERYVFVAPAAPVSAFALAVDFCCLFALFALVIYREVRASSS